MKLVPNYSSKDNAEFARHSC